ncbi:hypothetical protein M0805_003924 [Coniferiporia weirii]|nr:hypothetical protein M0805_003924 [Coniferiporia weirii]
MDDDGQHAQLGAMPPAYNRDNLEYELIVRQEPKQARMCGVGTKADRRPIDPPPVVQLRVVDKGASRSSSPDEHSNHYNQSFLQNPYYFMYASLASPERDEELHLLKDGKTRCTTGSVVSSLYHLKDPEADGERGQGRDAGFFVFPDLSVRTEGTYRLKLTLFEVIGANVHHCKSIFSATFYVYTAKKFPGMEESTNLSCALADQGIKIRIRKDVRVRKRTVDPTWFQPVQAEQEEQSDASDDEGRDPKRVRVNDSQAGPSNPAPPPPAPPAPVPAAGTWNIDPNLAQPPPPPPPASVGLAGAPDPAQYDPRGYSAGPPPPAPPGTHPDYHPPPPGHQHPHYMQHPPQPPPPNGMYPGSYGPPAPGWVPMAQGYGTYHQPAYDHHAHQQHSGAPPPPPPSHQHQQHRGMPQAGPYGAPLTPMHYNAPPPPPYGYYDQHGQYIPPPQHLPAAPASPRSMQQGVQQPNQQQRGKDTYPSTPTPMIPTHPPPPPAAYPAQDYGYARPPPPAPSSSVPPHQQARPYQPVPGPQAGPAPGPYASPAPQQQHMGHYLPQHQAYAYAQGDPYQQQQQWGAQYAQQPFAGGYAARPPWPAPPPGTATATASPVVPMQTDPYVSPHQPQPQPYAQGGYVRPGPDEAASRRSPPVPSISGQGRVYAAAAATSGTAPMGSTNSPQRNGVAGVAPGSASSSDRIQLAPLRQSAGSPTPPSSAGGTYGGYAMGRTNSQYGKKNPLSIGSIISDETG